MGLWPSLESVVASAAVTRAPDYGEPARAWRRREFVALGSGVPVTLLETSSVTRVPDEVEGAA
jgi:hypothetical protein